MSYHSSETRCRRDLERRFPGALVIKLGDCEAADFLVFARNDCGGILYLYVVECRSTRHSTYSFLSKEKGHDRDFARYEAKSDKDQIDAWFWVERKVAGRRTVDFLTLEQAKKLRALK